MAGPSLIILDFTNGPAVSYPQGLDLQERVAAARRVGSIPDVLILLDGTLQKVWSLSGYHLLNLFLEILAVDNHIVWDAVSLGYLQGFFSCKSRMPLHRFRYRIVCRF